MNSPVDRILFLQRAIGNQAVARLMKSGALQAKLRIGQPGDVYEQEADRVAEQVMKMPNISEAKDTRIQRKCPKCLKGLTGLLGKDKKEEKLQTKEANGKTAEVTSQIEANINALRGGGQPLPESVRAFYEPRFGQDFSQVRVHTNANAAKAAHAVNARAFTVGRDVIFGAGEYMPETGNRLLAHELTHVMQQNRSDVVRRNPKEPKHKSGEESEKANSFVIDLSLPEKNPEPDYSKTEDDIGAWEKAKTRFEFEFVFGSEITTMPDGTPGSYVSALSVRFKEPSFSVQIANHLWENAFSKSKPTEERIIWMKIHRRVYDHAFIHLKLYREAALKAKNEIQKSVDSLPTAKTPLALNKADLDEYLIKLRDYFEALIKFKFWKKTCDWEKEDYPKLLKGIHGVFGQFKVN
jgi:Domain of unknown function (DUF4157)